MEEKSKRRKKTDWLGTIGISLMLTAVVLMIWFFMHGETVVEGEPSGTERNVTLSCQRDGDTYPFFTYANYSDADTTIDVIFSNDKLGTIGLKQNLYYTNNDGASMSDANNHAAVNLKFQGEGMAPDSLGAAYVVSGNRFGMSLFADANSMNNNTAKYFLLESYLLNASVDKYVTYFENKGFSCTKTE